MPNRSKDENDKEIIRVLGVSLYLYNKDIFLTLQYRLPLIPVGLYIYQVSLVAALVLVLAQLLDHIQLLVFPTPILLPIVTQPLAGTSLLTHRCFSRVLLTLTHSLAGTWLPNYKIG